MAAEEEVRARAASRKAKYSGPMLRYHSKKQGDTSVVRPRLLTCWLLCGEQGCMSGCIGVL